MRNCMVGVRYCRNAIVVSGTRCAPAPNISSGTTVTMPAPASSSAWPGAVPGEGAVAAQRQPSR